MQTPYQILQLKQKQRKKIINESKKQRYFSIRYDKKGEGMTQCFMQKQRNCKSMRKPKQKNSQQKNHKNVQQQRKYQIIFRQSIRKVNAYRTKVYHNSNSIKQQKLVNRFITSRSEKPSTSPHQNFSFDQKNKYTQCLKRILLTQSKNCNQQQNLQTLNVGKYKIVMRNLQKQFKNQVIPQISIEKCKINFNANQNKQKIEQVIQSLYNHKLKMEKTLRKGSLDSYLSQRKYSSSQNKKTRSFDNQNDQNQHFKNFIKKDSAQQFEKNWKNLQFSLECQVKNSTNIPQSVDNIKVANFIKSKKKKRLPISLLTTKYKEIQQFQFRRTVTDQLGHRHKRNHFFQKIKDSYLSPKKNCGTKIKFNSLQQNISGWENSQNFNIKNNLSSTMNLENNLKSLQFQ